MSFDSSSLLQDCASIFACSDSAPRTAAQRCRANSPQKRLRNLLIAASFFMFCQGHVQAREVPHLTGPVVDEAGILSSSDKKKFESALSNFYQESGKQIQLVILASLEGDPLEDFSIRLAEKWKIGSAKLGSGVILLISLEDRAIRIEVGEGLEGEITDLQAGRIINDEMLPYFKKNDFNSGVAIGLQSIARLLGGELHGDFHIRQRPGDWLGFAFYAFIFLFFVLMPLLGGRRFSSGNRGIVTGLFLGSLFGGSGRSGGGGFGGFGGGGWSGGGGGFSGGGASGRW